MDIQADGRNGKSETIRINHNKSIGYLLSIKQVIVWIFSLITGDKTLFSSPLVLSS